MPISSSRAPESLARVPSTVAARAPSRPGPHRRAPAQPGAQAIARQTTRARRAPTSSGRKTRTIGRAKLCAESCSRRWATSARSPRPPASSTERVRWALAPETRSTSASSASGGDRGRDHEQQGACAGAARRSRPRRPRRRAAGRSRRRRRRRSGRRRRRRRQSRPAARKRDRGAAAARPRREAGQRRPGAGDDEHREQRLELVADPVEAHAEARVRPEQRERGERRAGDHVDRVGERPSAPRRPPAPGSRRAAQQGQRREQRRAERSTSSCSAPWPGSSAAPSSRTRGR